MGAATMLGLAASATDGIVSQNIVGYMNKQTNGTYVTGGSMFVTPGGTNTWKLSDLTASGMDPNQDMIQFLTTDSANTYVRATYISADYATANGLGTEYIGWWDMNDVGGTSLNNLEFAPGTGFLSSFGSTGITVTYAGEVIQSAETIDCSNKAYPLICNPVPRDITLSEITVTGMDPNQDMIQFLTTDSANTSVRATYISSEYATANDLGSEYIGWWDMNDVGGTSLNTTVLPAGSSVLGAFGSTGIKLTFPAAIK